MDTHVKQGEVYLQHQKHGSERWKKLWLVLYPSSRRGVGRLELSDPGGERAGMVRRQPERRVVRLAECVSVARLPPHAEACPGDNMAAFCVQTEDRRMVLAADRESCAEWVDRMCDLAFQGSSGGIQQQGPLMEENQIYVSREEVCEFRVCVQQTEASLRCGLQGACWLQVAKDTLLLRETDTRKSLMEWPYRLLRRYGRDKVMFSIEAGRRCVSGPGTFTFETRQGDQIFSLVESAICQQKTLAVTPGNRSPRSPLPKRPESAALLTSDPSSSSENVYSEPADLIGLAEPVYSNPADAIGSGKSLYSNPGDTIGLAQPVYSNPADSVNLQPTANNNLSIHPHDDLSEPVYADPADCLRATPDPDECVYADPADIINAPAASTPTPRHGNQAEPVYAEVCGNGQRTRRSERSPDEAVYSKPDAGTAPGQAGGTAGQAGGTPGSGAQSSGKQRAEELSALYSQVIKPHRPTQPTAKQPSAPQTPEVIYKDLGLI